MTYAELDKYCIDEGIKNAGKGSKDTEKAWFYRGLATAYMWVAAELQKANNEYDAFEHCADGFGERLKKAIADKNITQKEFATRLGTTEAAVSRYIKSNRTPRGVTLAKIANELDVTTDWLLGVDDE